MVSRLEKFSPDENEKYNSDMRNEWDAINEKEFSKEEGIALGIAKGRAEKNREVAKALLANNIDIPLIIKCTGLTEKEIIDLK